MSKRGRTQTGGTTGKNASFESLYAAHHQAVLAYCARRASRSDAWDAASEAFLVAWRRFDDVPPHEEARAWLLGVAYRVLANQRRSAHRRGRLVRRVAGSVDGPPASPDAQLIRNEEESEVIDALSRLRPLDREIITLTLWEELPPRAIAEVLGISRAAVDQRYSRAKRRLSQELAKKRLTKGRATQVTNEEGTT